VPPPQSAPPKSVAPSAASDPVTSSAGPGSSGLPPAADTTSPVDSTNASSGPDPEPAPAGADPDRSTGPAAQLGRPDPTPASVRAAVPAPLREWLAYLWPAIALSPLGEALATQVAALAPTKLPGLPPTPLDLFRPAEGAAAPGGGPEPAMPAAQAARPDPDLFSLPHGGGMSFLVTVITVLASLVGLVALARLTVGEDFFSLRWLR
jgi:hypothetical protein